MVNLAAAKLALKKPIETHYNIRLLREGNRAHKVPDIYYTNITQPNTIPFTYRVEAM